MGQSQHFAAIVLGATGNVGRSVVKQLLANPGITRVVVINRRAALTPNEDHRLSEVVVPDLSTLAEAVSSAARHAGATISICTIGIGKGSRTMSEADVRRVEIEYPREFARGCKAGGVLSVGLMTAVGANPHSSQRYLAIMGEKEKAVTDIGFPSLSIFRPSVIFGNSNTPSFMSYLYPPVEWLMPSRFHSIHKDDLAKAISARTSEALLESTPKVRILHYADMKKYF